MNGLDPALSRIARERALRKNARELSERAKPLMLRILGVAAESLVHGRTIVLNFLLLVLTLAIVWMAYQESQISVVVVHPFEVPDALGKRGYSAEVVGNRIGTHLRHIDANAGTGMRRERLVKPGASNVDIQIPGVGLNYQAIVRFAKDLLRIRDTRIVGDLVYAGDTLELRALVTRPGVPESIIVVRDSEKNLEAFLRTAAEEILAEVRPNLLASYHLATEEKKCRGRPSCDYAAAIRLYERVLGSDLVEDHKWALVGWAYVLDEMKQSEAAIAKAKQAIELDPSFTIAFNNWGAALSSLGRHEEAIDKFRRAAELDPKFEMALNNWGRELVILGRNTEAIDIYRISIQQNSRNSKSFVGWGAALANLGRDSEAIEKYSHASRLNPKDAEALTRWGHLLRRSKNHLQAVDKYRKAAQMDPNELSIFINWGLAMRELHNNNEAVQQFRRATELDPKDPLGHFYWAATLSDGKVGVVAEKFRIAIELGLKGDLLVHACNALLEMAETRPSRCQ